MSATPSTRRGVPSRQATNARAPKHAIACAVCPDGKAAPPASTSRSTGGGRCRPTRSFTRWTRSPVPAVAATRKPARAHLCARREEDHDDSNKDSDDPTAPEPRRRAREAGQEVRAVIDHPAQDVGIPPREVLAVADIVEQEHERRGLPLPRRCRQRVVRRTGARPSGAASSRSGGVAPAGTTSDAAPTLRPSSARARRPCRSQDHHHEHERTHQHEHRKHPVNDAPWLEAAEVRVHGDVDREVDGTERDPQSSARLAAARRRPRARRRRSVSRPCCKSIEDRHLRGCGHGDRIEPVRTPRVDGEPVSPGRGSAVSETRLANRGACRYSCGLGRD